MRQRIHALYRLRSTRVRAGQLAPAGVQRTTICSGRSLSLKGGPLDALLDSVRSYQGQPCASVAVIPQVVILRYATSTRRFVIDMSGCPGVVLNDGTKLIFATSTLIRATPILMATLRSAGAPTIGAPTIESTGAPDTVAMKPPSGLSHSQRATFVAGEAVAAESGCEGCHVIGASGNNGPGPPLTHIGRVRRPTAIAAALLNPTAPMPSFADLAKTSPKKFHELIQFLAMLN